MKSRSAALVALSAVLGIAAAQAGCGSKYCTELACESNLTFDFDGEYLPAGDYLVTVETSNGDASCELTVAADRSSDFDCSGDVDVEPSVEDVVIYDTPETASLDITRDGDAVTSAEAEPDYEDYYPNGPDCDDEACQVAFVTADLPDP